MTHRAADLRSWHDDWVGLRVVVLGLGEAGFAVADTLVELGATVQVLAADADAERERILGVLGVEVLGPERESELAARIALDDVDLVVLAAGAPVDHPLWLAARGQGLVALSDLELAWRLRDKVGDPALAGAPAPWLVIAGPGAEHAALLAEAILVAGGRRAIACGRERPVLDAVRFPDGVETIIAAATAEQLAGVESLSPFSSALLGIDALAASAWPSGAADYAATLGRVYGETRSAAVYLREDLATEELLREAEVVEGCRAIGVILGVPGPSDLGIVEGLLCDRAFLDDRRNSALELAEFAEVAAAGLDGPVELQRLLTAAALARSVGAEPVHVRDALRSFAGNPGPAGESSGDDADDDTPRG